MFAFNEKTMDGDELVDDTLDRFQIRLDNLMEWAENLVVRMMDEVHVPEWVKSRWSAVPHMLTTCDKHGSMFDVKDEPCWQCVNECWLAVKLICAFDSRAECFRRKIVKEYKAQRTHNPLAYVTVEECYKMLENSDDWQRMMSPDGYEADDLIASIAHQADEPVIIHSADKDFNQCLVDGRVGIVKRSGSFEGISVSGIQYSEFELVHYKYRDFVNEYNFTPARWVPYQCLVGDQADNVKGAVGIGPTMAKSILQNTCYWIDESTPRHFAFNSRQRAHWPDFLERWDDLREVFTLRTDLPVELNKEQIA